MTDLETFCRQLHQNRGYHVSWGGVDVVDLVLASPAARLALQRSEAANEQRPRLLHQLIERYESNECQEPCDHVYALYSLVRKPTSTP